MDLRTTDTSGCIFIDFVLSEGTTILSKLSLLLLKVKVTL